MEIGETRCAPNGFCYVFDPRYNPEKPYKALQNWDWYSERYKKWISIKEGYRSDGASGAIDIPSFGWWGHDKLCETRVWSDGSHCSTLQESMTLFDILWSEKRYRTAIRWGVSTFCFRTLKKIRERLIG